MLTLEKRELRSRTQKRPPRKTIRDAEDAPQKAAATKARDKSFGMSQVSSMNVRPPEERWHKRPALHGGMRRIGVGIIRRWKGIERGLRKSVEN